MKPSTSAFLLVILIASCTPTVTPSSANTPLSPTPIAIPATQVTQMETDTPPAATPITSPFSPDPNDINLQRGEVFIKESGITLRESSPVQVVLALSGELPTPCHQLRVAVEPPDDENKILIDVYTVVDPGMICTQVLKPFQEMVELGTFPRGHYTVWVNGTQVGEFDA